MPSITTPVRAPADLLPAAPATGSRGNSLGKQEFLNLLVLQLRNQDPLNPMNDREFIAQTAQLSALELTAELSAQLQEMAIGQQQTQALQMVGREVEYAGENGEAVRGQVTGVRLTSVPPLLLIGEREVPVNQIRAVL